jgi:thiol:disulfide interchange protein DsbD
VPNAAYFPWIRSRAAAGCLLLSLVCAGGAWGGPGGQEATSLALTSLGSSGLQPGETPVRARLIAARHAAEAGETVLVGLHLQQDEGWHTYWRNPGDAGLPTRIRWELPKGMRAGGILWPAPHEFTDPADVLGYGYDVETVLLSEISLDDDLGPGEYTLLGHVDWLMCREVCILDSTKVKLSLKVGIGAGESVPSERELIEAAKARLPRPASEWPRLRLDLTTPDRLRAGERGDALLRVAGVSDGTSLRWFPYAPETLYPGRAQSFEEDPLALRLPFEIDEMQAEDESIAWGGVLVITEPNQAAKYVELEIPLAVGSVAATGLFDTSRDAMRPGGPGTTSRSLLYYLALAFVGGLILNIMPCVLPVLSLKVLGFVRHANESRATQLRLGLLFAAGVLASFLALALVVVGIQQAGDQLGWGFQFQNPVFVVVMATVVFAFGLSLFGVFEILLPMGSVGVGVGGTRGAGTESFFNGILATALATPCTAPFLGTALGFAFTQPPAGIVSIFLSVGLGLAAPYVILSVNPAWLRFVPKPGSWMVRFKQAMGFLLMGTLVWLLWVLARQLGADAVIWTLAFLCTVGFALWFYGSALTLSSGRLRRSVVLLLMIAMIGGGAWGFLREPLSVEYVAAQATASDQEDGDWLPFSVVGLEEQVAAGNTVLVDFTADWCATCKVNEKTVLSTDEIQSKLEELRIVTMLGDYTRRDPEITKVLRRFGRSGVPLYVVFPAGRIDEPIVLPELITKGIVLDALDRAGPSQVQAASRIGI